jgi:hypothetical protein
LDIQNKINILIEILEFKNLKNFADKITNSNLDRAKGLSSGRIKKFYPSELAELINTYNVNEKWLLGTDSQILKNNLEENRTIKLDIINLDKKVENFLFFDKTLLKIENSEVFFLIKSFDNCLRNEYLLCKKTTSVDFSVNDSLILTINKKFQIKKIKDFIEKELCLVDYFDGNIEVKMTKDEVSNILFGRIERKILIDFL